ncbi:MAG: amidohydrolase family protein [Bacteroidetes bacterium]|nr:amidohydrolase family protein [Bacteroidota bacterium]
MSYRKLKGTNLFTGREMLDDAVLIIDGDGVVQDILPQKEAGEGIEVFEGIISPGFVNCHCHLELSNMKGLIPEKTGLVNFLLSVVKKRGGSLESNRQAIADAEMEMRKNGIIAVGDICNTVETLPQKLLGNLYYHNFIETIGFVEATANQRFESSYAVFKQFAEQYGLPIESNSIVPHAPYSVSKKLFEMIANFPGNHLLSIHNQEIEAENDFLQYGKGDFLRLYQEMGLDISFFKPTGKRTLESYLPYFYKNQSLILVHNVATGEEDFASMAVGGSQMAGEKSAIGQRSSANLFFCLCPNANKYISGDLPDINLLIEKDCNIVVGTDSLASNKQLDILAELKTIQQHFPHIPTATLLQWATLNGACALQLESITGSFEPGKQPGIVLIEHIDNGKLSPQSKSSSIL